MTDNVISIVARLSERDEGRTLYSCNTCGCASFKLIGFDDGLHLGCANCEAWIDAFDVTFAPDDPTP